MDEKQAIALLKRGDLQGLEALIQAYQLQAVRAAALITGDRDLSEDIVQNAFIRAADRIAQYDPQRPFGPWFFRSVVNDAVKAANRQKRFVSLDTDNGEETYDLFDPAPLPEEIIEAKETQQAVWQALQKLPANQRAAIVLRYYLGMHEDEMIEELHSPAGSVKWWLHAARQRLQKLLSPDRSSEENSRPGSTSVQESGEKR
ncbi:MAG TPA: RNA polymerase subunit sigma-24 [Anaerolineaceae bacterium]|nr:RNA polymerase subunit sigma-24 [Anaerolineaceae bacterium]